MNSARSAVRVRTDVPMEMRDGTTLAADLYEPADARRHPTLVRRTPYDKRAWSALARALAERGYVVLIQDIRGRHGSSGEFSLGDRSADAVGIADGTDTVEWAARYERSDGQVGVWGHSYDGWTGWQAAVGTSTSLRGVVAASFPRRSVDVSRGIFDIGRRMHWYYRMAVDARRRVGRTDGPATEELADRVWVDLERWKWLLTVPLDAVPESVYGPLTDDFRRHMRGIAREQFDLDAYHPRVIAPVFVVTGWWDRMVSAIDNYAGLVAHGPRALARSHRLLVGPWGHQPPTFESRVRGSVDFGPSSVRSFVDIVAGWFDRICKGAGGADAPPVELFVVNEGWRHEEDWPPADVQVAELYLRSGGHANGSSGDGSLAWQAPTDEPADHYDYDPRDPVISLMEPNSHWAPYDQRPNDHRRDKLVYRTEPLTKAVTLIGPVSMSLWAASDAPDTDWVVQLIDEPPEGPAIAVSQGIMRARYRAGYAHNAPVDLSEPYCYEIRMTPVGARFPEGHRIRIDVTSSDFPNYDRNHNTGRDYWSDGELRVARQTVFHDRARPSRLAAPLLAR